MVYCVVFLLVNGWLVCGFVDFLWCNSLNDSSFGFWIITFADLCVRCFGVECGLWVDCEFDTYCW